METRLTLCSSVGGVALKALFGLDVSSVTTELKIIEEQDDKLEAVSRVVSILEQHITETESSSVSSCCTKISLQEVIFLTSDKKAIQVRSSSAFFVDIQTGAGICIVLIILLNLSFKVARSLGTKA